MIVVRFENAYLGHQISVQKAELQNAGEFWQDGWQEVRI
jgi:hypothetical protein